MQIVYFLTYEYSFKLWEETGNISRESEYFKFISSKHDDYFFYFISYGNEKDESFTPFLKNSKIIPIYKYMKYDKNKFIRFIRSFKIPFILKKILRNENIDIIKQNQLQGIWISLFFKILMKKPLITRTGYDVLSFKIREKKGFHKIIFFYLLTQLALIFSDIYTVTSNIDKIFLKKYFYVSRKNDKLRIRSNFVKTSKYLSLDNRTNNEILMVGRLEQQKNYRYVINEFANSQYRIDNYGSGEDFAPLVKLSKENNVNIQFRDVIPNKKLLEILNRYKFFISCSLFEGNPKSILEAMGAGCIVFAARNPNIEEIITDGVTGFLFDLNENELIDLFQSSIDRGDLNKISKSAVKFVKENNNLENLVKNESSDLQELLG